MTIILNIVIHFHHEMFKNMYIASNQNNREKRKPQSLQLKKSRYCKINCDKKVGLILTVQLGRGSAWKYPINELL